MQWNSEASPVQTGKVAKAIDALRRRGCSFTKDVGPTRMVFATLSQEPSVAAQDAAHSIGDQFRWKITPGNAGAILKAFKAATEALSIPHET